VFSVVFVNKLKVTGLGHVRLSIIDLSPSGNQPFHDEQGRIHAVVNGELYDYERYKAQLSDEFKFVGNSDSEIVIALYKHYGLSFISHLRGEFAFVLWDENRQQLIAARDRYGIKSLYYTVHENKLLVATEIKSFLAFGLQPEWCVRTLRDQSWRVASSTFFQGVYKVDSTLVVVYVSLNRHLTTTRRSCPVITLHVDLMREKNKSHTGMLSTPTR
jgi:asparagine synthase (glutamine-hydrolysing)